MSHSILRACVPYSQLFYKSTYIADLCIYISISREARFFFSMISLVKKHYTKMSEIKIISVNCQGLNDNLKRRDVFQYFRHQNCSILCLIDTHFTLDMEQTVRDE